jgi:acyl-CoA-binding protein
LVVEGTYHAHTHPTRRKSQDTNPESWLTILFSNLQKKQLFGAWEKVKDYNPSKANQLYIAHVNTLIAKYGTSE